MDQTEAQMEADPVEGLDLSEGQKLVYYHPKKDIHYGVVVAENTPADVELVEVIVIASLPYNVGRHCVEGESYLIHRRFLTIE